MKVLLVPEEDDDQEIIQQIAEETMLYITKAYKVPTTVESIPDKYIRGKASDFKLMTKFGLSFDTVVNFGVKILGSESEAYQEMILLIVSKGYWSNNQFCFIADNQQTYVYVGSMDLWEIYRGEM